MPTMASFSQRYNDQLANFLKMYQTSRAIINQHITDPSSYCVRRALPMRPRCLKLTAPSSVPAPLLPCPSHLPTGQPRPLPPCLPLGKRPHIPATQSCFTLLGKFYQVPLLSAPQHGVQDPGPCPPIWHMLPQFSWM